MHHNGFLMNATELLCYLTDKQVDSLFTAARSVPADKLDWKPAPGARSALDQVQEAATAIDKFWSAYESKKVEWDQEAFNTWQAERGKLTSLDELERICKEQTKRLTDFIRKTNEDDLSLPVSMPFPGDFKFADILAYHYWNCSYHEGQINYIVSMLE